MHCLFENVAPAMLRHWTGTFFRENKKDMIIDDDYILDAHVWTAIGKLLEDNKQNMPTEFGRPPIDIHKHSHGFKAEHWLNWITLYSLPVLCDKLPERLVLYVLSSESQLY
jgi:hypothetical protein